MTNIQKTRGSVVEIHIGTPPSPDRSEIGNLQHIRHDHVGVEPIEATGELMIEIAPLEFQQPDDDGFYENCIFTSSMLCIGVIFILFLVAMVFSLTQRKKDD